MSNSFADVTRLRAKPNPWCWSAAASLPWQAAWAGAIGIGLVVAVSVLLPGLGPGAVALIHVVFHELGHAAVAAVGDGQVHAVVVGAREGMVRHTPGSDLQELLVKASGILAPAVIAAIMVMAGITRQAMELALVFVAVCLAGTARFASVDGAATEVGLYTLAAASVLAAGLPGLPLAKASACLAWAVALALGLVNAAPGLFAQAPIGPGLDPPLPTDTQALSALLGMTVGDVALSMIAAQIALGAFAALWAANWMTRYA